MFASARSWPVGQLNFRRDGASILHRAGSFKEHHMSAIANSAFAFAPTSAVFCDSPTRYLLWGLATADGFKIGRALERRGPIGQIAASLFETHRANIAAHRCPEHYERKAHHIANLTKCLSLHDKQLGITWGWKDDHVTKINGRNSWAIYLDLPEHGQVGFHLDRRLNGPEYQGQWDRGASDKRIIAFVDAVNGQAR
jgi:hypothetical protein